MKRIKCFFLAFALVLILPACSTNAAPQNSPVNSSEPAVSSDTPNTKDISSVKDVNITIEVYSWNYDINEAYLATCDGTYTGEMLNGVPSGTGRFDSQNDRGDTWYYEGQFKNGRFDGQGGCYWSDGYSEVGTYVDGSFHPTYLETLEHLSQFGGVTFGINSASKTFLLEHETLFPAVTEQASAEAEALIDPSIAYPQIEKSLANVQGKFCKRENTYVIQAEESNLYGSIVTTLLVSDEDFDNFLIYFNGSLPDVYSDTYITFTGLPIATTSFSNIGGGTTKVAVIAASSVDLV